MRHQVREKLTRSMLRIELNRTCRIGSSDGERSRVQREPSGSEDARQRRRDRRRGGGDRRNPAPVVNERIVKDLSCRAGPFPRRCEVGVAHSTSCAAWPAHPRLDLWRHQKTTWMVGLNPAMTGLKKSKRALGHAFSWISAALVGEGT